MIDLQNIKLSRISLPPIFMRLIVDWRVSLMLKLCIWEWYGLNVIFIKNVNDKVVLMWVDFLS